MRASYHPGLQPAVLGSSAWPPRAWGWAVPVTVGSGPVEQPWGWRVSFRGGWECPVRPLWIHQLRALRFPSVPLWLFYKMHFLQKHRKIGTALPLWPAAFNLQLSCWAASLEAIQIPSQIHSVSPHSFSTIWPHPKVKIIQWFELKHGVCLVNKSTPFLFILCL